MLPLVSILIPCYNAEKWIVQAIESALNQAYPNKEVIVLDDGSSDTSLEMIKSFGNAIRWETQSNQGGNAARNELLRLSKGEWLQYLDADDYLLPDKIEKQFQFLIQVAPVDVIYSPSILEYWEEEHSRQEILSIPEPYDPWILLARWYLPQTGSPLWRKQAIVDVGGWKPDQPCCQEHELYLRLLVSGKRFEYFGRAGSVYRQWSESTVCKRDKSETYQRRLAITDLLEEYLESCNQLTPLRQNAINQARFECARIIWLSNPSWAHQIITQIRVKDKNFTPTSNAAPLSYRLTYKILGFSLAENFAFLKRQLFSNHLSKNLGNQLS